MKNMILAAIAASTLAFSVSTFAGYWDLRIYNYIDENGAVVGTIHFPCHNRQARIVGQTTRTKVLVEAGTCR